MLTQSRRQMLAASAASLGAFAARPLFAAKKKEKEEPDPRATDGPLFVPTTLFLTWQRDPTTTMTVQWIGTLGETKDTAVTYATDPAGPWQSMKSNARPYPMTDFKVFRAELTGLNPGTDYHFRIGKSSPTYRFRTMPAKATDTIHFISGGDCGSNGHTIANNIQAARQDPMFTVVGGDLGYDDGTSVERSIAFIRNYSRHMVSGDGRLIPMVVCLGNHEVQGSYHQPREKAPFFYALFDGLYSESRAAEVLGTMRGLAAKVGQMASYVDGLVPESKRDAFETSLKVLRAQAPRSSAAQVRVVIEEDLGAPIDALFVEFDDIPIASASIGQVHRARLPEHVMGGVEVAVKVQHPGIRKAVDSDLANAGILESMGAMLGARRFDTKTQLAVLRERFREELDYGLEARRLTAFRRLHEADPTIRIPRLVEDRSGANVLTSELVEGRALDAVMQEPEAARRAWGETLWRFVFKGNLVGGMFNADPHPGNYLFQEDGRIAFLDYGCVQVIPEHRRPQARALHRAALARDEDEFARCVSLLLDAHPGEMEKLARRYSRLCFNPLFESPYRITRSYAASLVDEMKSLAMAARKMPEADVFAMPGEMLFMNRLQFGFYSVLARLDVEIDYAAVERQFIPQA